VSNPLKEKYQMLKIIEFGRKTAPNIIYLKTLCLIVRMKILLMGCLFGKMKNFKHIIPFLMALLFLATPNAFWAQDSNWPWIPNGENFQITKNLGDHFSPSVASNGDLYLGVWYASTPSGFDIYGARITKEGKILDEEEIQICTAPNDQMFPSVAWDGESFFVVWQDRRNGKRWDIYGTRISIDGEVLNPDGIPIALGKSTNDQVSPTLSFDGENYIVVWQGKVTSKVWNVYFSIVSVSKDGEVTVKGKKAINPIAKNQISPAVAFNGENYFIVWQDFRSGKFWDIYGARVTPSGNVFDEDKDGIPISPIVNDDINGWDKWRPVISWNGSFFLVIWTASQEEEWYLEGKRVDVRGIPDVYDAPLQKNTTNKIFPAILWDGEQTLLVWEEEPEGESKIFGASTLSPFEPFVVSVGRPIPSPKAKDPSLPAVSGIGDESLVIWQGKGDDDSWHIYGQRFKKVPKILTVGPV
jgi:hypothetical protein